MTHEAAISWTKLSCKKKLFEYNSTDAFSVTPEPYVSSLG